jgi:hypothetical protein
MQHMYRLYFGLLLCLLPAATPLFGQWHHLQAGQPEVIAFAADSSGQRMILSAKHAGVWLSNDGGESWEGINSRISDGGYVEVEHFDIADPNGWDIMSEAYDPFDDTETRCFSGDGGETWHGHLPVSEPDWWGVSLQAWRANPDIWFYLARRYSSSTNEGRLFRTSDQGASWDTVSSPSSVYRGFLYQDPFNDSLLYAAGRVSNYYASVTRSTDLGATWGTSLRLSTSGVYVPLAHDMVRLSNSKYIVLVEQSSEFSPGVWSLALTGDSTGTQFDVVPDVWDWDFPQAVLEDRTSPGTVILAASCTGGLMRSTDYGETWQRSLAGLPDSRQGGAWLYQNPYGGALYAGISGFGVMRSDDHGASWQEVRLPIGAPVVSDQFMFTVAPSAVYFQPGFPYWFPQGSIFWPGVGNRDAPAVGTRSAVHRLALHL